MVTVNDIIHERLKVKSKPGFIPINIATLREYTGVNVLLLTAESADNESKRIFGTYKQITSIGCRLKDKCEREFDHIAIGYRDGLKLYYRVYESDNLILSDIGLQSIHSIMRNRRLLSLEEIEGIRCCMN